MCATRACLGALETRHVTRAFRRAVIVSDTLLAETHALAERKVLELVGLARRQGTLKVGVDRLAGNDAAGAFVLFATDLSDRGQRRLAGRASAFLDAARLGQACGMGRVGALSIAPGALAKQAAYWRQVWYETAPSGEDEVDDG